MEDSILLIISSFGILFGAMAGYKNKPKEMENVMDMSGTEEVWKKGTEKIMTEIEEMKREIRGEMEGMKEEIGRLNERLIEERKAREEERKREKEE